MERGLGMVVALSAVIALGCGGDDVNGPGGGSGSKQEQGLMLQICQRLVAEGFAETCGTEIDECRAVGPGCLQLGYPDVPTDLSGGEVSQITTEPPQDMAALLEKIEFLGPEAVEAASSATTGTVTWGDPRDESLPYVEIDLERVHYHIYSCEIPTRVVPGEETLPESYYEEDVVGYFAPMGIDPAQTGVFVSATMASGSDGTFLSNRTIYVNRIINGIRLEEDKLTFSYDASNGKLYNISGTWHRINYAESQFALKHTSVDELAGELIEQLGEWGIERTDSAKMSSLRLAYHILEPSPDGSNILDLKLRVQRGTAVHDMDI